MHNSAETPTELHVLRFGAEPVNSDIVAVHGLDGHPFKTWTHANGHLWLRDSLPHRLPNTRIMTFGYDAAVFTKSFADVRLTAKALLSELNTWRTGVEGRPIIFICHSLGGILFKETLNFAHTTNPDDVYRDILDSTKAVAFLATPHGGVSGAWWYAKATSFATVLNANLVPQSRDFAECLQRNSGDLARISMDFVRRAKPLIIKSFCETRGTGKANLSIIVVDEDSATMRVPNEQVIPVLHADHISISKFPSGYCSEFVIVAQEIADLVRSLVRKPADDQQNPASNTLKIDALQCLYEIPEIIKQAIKPRVPDTCAWVLKHSKYNQWQESNTSTILWISAPPGYGKTVLATFLEARHVQQKTYREITVCSFFCGRTMENQKSAVSILRMILWQLLRDNRELIRHAVPWYETQGEKMAHDLDTLWALCTTCFEDPNLGETVVILDALDECHKWHRDELMRWIRVIFKYRSDRHLSPLKLIITSLPDTFGTSQLDPMIIVLRLDKDSTAAAAVSRDVDRVINARVLGLAKSRDDFQNDAEVWLRKHLRENAGRTFLWATSVLQQLESASSLSRVSIGGRLNDLPADLADLYHRNLSRIPKEDRPTSRLLLCLITASKRPLSVVELNWATAVLLTEGDSEKANDYMQSSFGDTVQRLCGHMVDISDGRVYFSHRTFRDFLTPASIDSSNAKPWYVFTELEANVRIIKCCIWRVHSLKELASDIPAAPARSLLIRDEGREMGQNDLFFGKICFQEPFFEYAVAFLAKQYSDVEPHASEELVQHMQNLYFDDAAFTLWNRGYWMERHSKQSSKLHDVLSVLSTISKLGDVSRNFFDPFEEMFEFSARQFRMMCLNRHTRLFQHLLRLDPSLCQGSSADGWTTFNTVIDMGQMELVAYMLDHGADVNFIALGSAPIHRVALSGNTEVMRLLIDRHADVNIQDSNGMTPLHITARSGCMQAVQLLLASKAQLDMLNRERETPLHQAASQGHIEVVVLLTEYGSNYRIRDLDGAVPLSKAMERGQESVVRFLLKHMNQEDLQNPDNTFLHAAVRVKNPAIVVLLLDGGIDMDILDKRGRTAFSYTSSDCDKSIYEAFLEKGTNVNARVGDGSTLLHEMATVGNLAAMQYLLDRNADVHELTNEGDTVLHYAVAHGGHKDVFQFLLDNGADIEARNKLGETPLHKAVVSWRSQDTIDLLYKMNAKLEVRNNKGQTPLQIAAENQNAGLTLELLRKGADFNVKTDEGHDIFYLAEMSFEKHFISYRRQKIQKVQYSTWAITRDDDVLQKFPGNLEQAAITKIDLITEWLGEYGVKEDGAKEGGAKEDGAKEDGTKEIPHVESKQEMLPHD